MLSKMEEYVKFFDFKDNSSFVRGSLTVFFDFLDLKENFLKTPESAQKFLEEIEPRLIAQKIQDAFLLIYQNLSKEEQEAIFYKIDQNRKESITDKREFIKMKQTAILHGYEIVSKVGYMGECYIGKFKKPFLRPVTPEATNEWNLMTLDQKITLLEDQHNKLIECNTIDHMPHHIQNIERNIAEITKGIKDDSKFENV